MCRGLVTQQHPWEPSTEPAVMQGMEASETSSARRGSQSSRRGRRHDSVVGRAWPRY